MLQCNNAHCMGKNAAIQAAVYRNCRDAQQ
jgi:hypothetical protein